MAKHILVLSSKPEVIQRLHDTLEPEGYRVTAVAAEADIAEEVTRITEVTRQEPDLVILTPGSPDEDVPGYESRNMKSLGGTSNPARPRVLVLSSRAPGDVLMEFDTGADWYLVERFLPRELLGVVRRLIGLSEG